jgi:low affinity Fe/Cu permease
MADSNLRRVLGDHFHVASFIAASMTGNAIAVVFGISAAVVWAVAGAFAGFSSHWLAASNGTLTVGTLLLLLLLRHAEAHNRKAVQTKLDELIRSSEAGNHLIASEHLPEVVLQEVRRGHHGRAHGS